MFRVLLVEDSRANQLAISRLLRAQGVDVTVVNDGSAAVVKLVGEKAAFDLAFFDINMPIMGGCEALRQVRAAGIDMPIIALTASVEQDELRAGAVRHFSPCPMIERRVNVFSSKG
jgi:CheY-like chemotaxis protein